MLGLKRASDFCEPDTSYFLPWKIEMIYQVEPSLEETVKMCRANRRKNWYKRLDVYSQVKNDTYELCGWGARDPRLRCCGAYDCFIQEVIDALNI